MDSIKITRLELENVKRIKAVALEPNENGLTIIGGKNGEGKTSVLDSIAWALGGEKRRPTNAHREGSMLPPEIRITMNNGLIVERKGKNSSLSVTDPDGKRAGQQLLDSFIAELALDVPKFLKQSDKEKAETLLKVIGLDDQVAQFERKEKEAFDRRTVINRMFKEKAHAADAMPEYSGVPEEYIDPADLVRRQQAIFAKNTENAQLRLKVDTLNQSIFQKTKELENLESELKTLREEYARAYEASLTAIDEPTDEIEQQIDDFTEINRKIRANNDKRNAMAEAKVLEEESTHLTDDINKLRSERMNLFANADLPLPELSVEEGKLTYKGKAWDCMSASEQLMVATAIVRKLKPQCGFVLLDKLEQLDKDTLAKFGAWLVSEDLQVIATRVTTDTDDCTILIEDGRVAETKEVPKTEIKKWKASE